MSYQAVGVTGNTSFNKIPEYARDYKKEYLFIIGLDKKLRSFIGIKDKDKFSSSKADRIKGQFDKFVKAQEKGRLKKDISNLHLKLTDVNYIVMLECELDNYGDLFYGFEAYPIYTNENDRIKFNEFLESFLEFKEQLKTEEESDIKYNYDFIDSDSDSDIF